MKNNRRGKVSTKQGVLIILAILVIAVIVVMFQYSNAKKQGSAPIKDLTKPVFEELQKMPSPFEHAGQFNYKGWQTYQEEEFELRYPPEWVKALDDEVSKPNILQLGPTPKPRGGWPIYFEWQSRNIDEVILRDMRNTSAIPLGRSEFSLNGNRAVALWWRTTYGIVYVSNPGETFTLKSGFLIGHDLHSTLEQIMSSIEFK